MTVRNEPVDIAVDDQFIAGTLFIPAKAVGRVLFAHGWGGNQKQYLRRASTVADLGYLCLTFDLRGHARGEEQRETVSRAENLRDLLAAYDLLTSRPDEDSSVIGIVGSSYGGYLAAILTSLRPAHWMALRAPALYKDTDWELPKVQLHHDPDFASYRRRPVRPESNRALRACAAFRGDVLIVESENDDTVPHQVIENYLAACKSARSLTFRVVKGANHGLTEEAWQRESTSYLVEWLKARRAAFTPA